MCIGGGRASRRPKGQFQLCPFLTAGVWLSHVTLQPHMLHGKNVRREDEMNCVCEMCPV